MNLDGNEGNLKFIIVKVRKWSLNVIGITPEVRCLSDTLVKIRSIIDLESRVTRVGEVISCFNSNKLTNSIIFLQQRLVSE